MRILHISKVKGIAGSEKHLLMLLPGLAGKGIDVSMLTLEDPHIHPASFCQELEASGIPNTRMPIRHHLDPGLLSHMTKYLKTHRPDLVHTHLLHADLYGLYAARRAGIPYAVSSRHNDNPFRRNLFIHWMNRRAMQYASRVITISHALARFVRDVERVDEKLIVTVHYGLDPTAPDPGHRDTARRKLGYQHDEMVVGFFGRLIPQKGVDILLDALKRVGDRHPAARLLIVGDGALRSRLERLTAKLGLGEIVRFTGWVEKAHHLMPACDLIVMPSRWEGFGLVALEAMNAARPLIVTRVSALPEIVEDGITGMIVPPEDPAALADAVNGLLADPAQAKALGRAGHERLLTTFSIENMVQATLDVYTDILSSS